jgi:hypothetical protein
MSQEGQRWVRLCRLSEASRQPQRHAKASRGVLAQGGPTASTLTGTVTNKVSGLIEPDILFRGFYIINSEVGKSIT